MTQDKHNCFELVCILIVVALEQKLSRGPYVFSLRMSLRMRKTGEGESMYGESRQVFMCVRNLIPFERP